MKTAFRTSFARDLKKIKDNALLGRIRQAIEKAEAAAGLSDVGDLTKITGTRDCYRIRVGDSGGAQWVCGIEDTLTDERGISSLVCHPGKPLIMAQLVGYETVKGPAGPVDLPAGGEVNLRFALQKK